ncbi:MAG: aldehyde dehydrogenase family protein [Pseudobdellovibrio sp.]
MSKTYKTYNPASGAFLKERCFVDLETIQNSLDVLQNGFNEWKKLSFKDRQEKLKAVNDILKTKREEIAKSITEEMGKPYYHSLAEVDKSLKAIDYMCEHDYVDLEPKKTHALEQSENTTYEVVLKPKGIILGIMPWNFPLWQSIRMIYPTILMGNTVLLKQSEITPTTGEILDEVFKKCGLSSIFRHHIFHHENTEAIIADPRVKGVSLTGSVRAGRTLSSLAGKYMKKGVFELGGSDPYLVLEDADIEKSAQVIAKTRLINTGQTCIAAKRAFVPKEKANFFYESLVKQLEKMSYGNLYERSTQLGSLAHVKFREDDLVRYEALKKYSNVIYEKYVSESFLNTLTVNSEMQAYAPVRVLKIKNNKDSEMLDLMKENEFFSPTLIVFEYDNIEEALALVNGTDFGLGGAVFSQDLEKARHIALQIDSGMVGINEAVKSDVMLPFGGVKSSGQGREMGLLGFYEFCDSQVVATHKF